jgi:hypothetical protein
MNDKIKMLYDKDDKIAYNNLLELESEAEESNEIYSYFEEFLSMLNDEKTFVRVRAFRLICALAKWDNANKININIDLILNELDDDTSTSVRQCLNKLNLILLYKPELSEKIEIKLRQLNLSKYKESMQSLIKRDIDSILQNI